MIVRSIANPHWFTIREWTCNGEENILCRWHWVTIIALEYAEGGGSAFANILDEGLVKKIDLAYGITRQRKAVGLSILSGTISLMHQPSTRVLAASFKNLEQVHGVKGALN